MTPIVRVTGWRAGFKTISFVKLFRKGSQPDRSLADAKTMVDGLLDGKSIRLVFEHDEEAQSFVEEAVHMGAIATKAADEGSVSFAQGIGEPSEIRTQ